MNERVRIDQKDGVADVRLDRAEKLNALDIAMFEALIAAGEELAARPSLRAVVLSGEGRSFCAGLDFASFMADPSTLERMLARQEAQIANFAQRAAWIWREVPVPVIAAIHGHAYGGGLQLVAAADIRLVTADAKLSIREIQWGLIPDMSGTQTLRHLLRHDVLKELTFTGRAVSGTEAVSLGLATRVCEDPRAEALALAREIATKSPDAIRVGKALLDEVVVGSTEDGLLAEERAQRKLLRTKNQLEAVAAGMTKRPPKFDDPA